MSQRLDGFIPPDSTGEHSSGLSYSGQVFMTRMREVTQRSPGSITSVSDGSAQEQTTAGYGQKVAGVQLEILEREFTQNPNMWANRRLEIARETRLTPGKVQFWFQNQCVRTNWLKRCPGVDGCWQEEERETKVGGGELSRRVG
ncbi:hypothetical protein NMY22_g12280 [Coprinellus aureogranulatus]|nr:hypothetical protein NMY22_g12280 [Coprinellus aureogranulatus]